MSEVKWIKINVDFLDGFSFKCMRKAKVEGVADFRDKLEAVWFELLALAGKVNDNGKVIDNVIDNEIAFKNFLDIAVMLDRSEEEIKLCMDFYVKQGMITFIDDCYMLSNWSKYQNTEELKMIQSKKSSERQKKFKELHPDYYKTKYLQSKADKNVNKKYEESQNNENLHFDNVIDNVYNAIDKEVEVDVDVEKNKTKKNESNKEESFDQLLSRLVTNEKLKTKLIEFIKMRKLIKHPITNYALELTIQKLDKMTKGNVDYQLKILDNSILNSWQGIFDLPAEDKIAIDREKMHPHNPGEEDGGGQKIDLDKLLGDDI